MSKIGWSQKEMEQMRNIEIKMEKKIISERDKEVHS